MEVFNKIQADWLDLMDNKSDPRVSEWPLASSPFPTLMICLTYVYIVKVNICRNENRQFFICLVRTVISSLLYSRCFIRTLSFIHEVLILAKLFNCSLSHFSWTFLLIIIINSHFSTLQVLGPRIMENRKPFKMRSVIVVYNFIQVILSFYLFWEVSVVGWFNDYSWRCQPIDRSNSEMGMRVSFFNDSVDAWCNK